MNSELNIKVEAAIKSFTEKKEKASDMDVIIKALKKLPPGQLKKVLTDEVLDVLKKYDIT